MLEIHWTEQKIDKDFPNPDRYLHAKQTPAKSAAETWKWAAKGEMLLCAKMLQRPIICVAPDFKNDLSAHIYLPTDSSFRVCFTFFTFFCFAL